MCEMTSRTFQPAQSDDESHCASVNESASAARSSIWSASSCLSSVTTYPPEVAGRFQHRSGQDEIIRCQLNGPKVFEPDPAHPPDAMVSLSHSSGKVLPCTVIRWKFATS